MPKTLLLADDSVVIQKLVGLSFANEDVRLFTTDNGNDALLKAREVRPDLVLADVVMPGMSGYDVCAAIKRDAVLGSTPVLLLTGTFEAFDEERARQAGADGHITKPFEAQALVERVNRLLAQSRPSQPAAAPKAADDAFDFFDDRASESAGPPVTMPPAPRSATRVIATAELEDAFSFASADDELTHLDEAELIGEPLDLEDDHSARGGDRTVALAAGPGRGSQESPTVTSLAIDDFDPLAAVASSLGSAAADPVLPPSARRPGSDSTAGAWPVAYSTTRRSPTPPAREPVPPVAREAASPFLRDEDSFSSRDTAPSPAKAALTILDSNEMSEESLSFGGEAGGVAAKPAPAQPRNVLPDDLFASDPFFASEGQDASSPPELEFAEPPSRPRGFEATPEVAADYDVSSSDLGDPFARPARPLSPEDDLLGPARDFGADFDADPAGLSLSEGLLASTQPRPKVYSEPTRVALEEPAAVTPSNAARGPAPDVTPMMRDRIHETLERVAWEAFADLSDTLVKQVLERVEAIAWEVIPQMAETLIRDEIRRMKAEDGE